MENLVELLAQDLSALDDEALAAGLRDAEFAASTAPIWSKQLVAELKSRHTWAEVVKLTGIPRTTLHNRLYGRPTSKPDE